MSAYPVKAIAAVALSFALTVAIAQTVLSIALEQLTRYTAAAATLVANAVLGVNAVEAAQIPLSERKAVREELNEISFTISSLRSAQAPLITDLSEYVQNARAGSVDVKTRESDWRYIVSSVNRVSERVRTTPQVVERSRWLKVALDEHDRLELREVLLARGSVLGTLQSLPAPATTDEINQLDKMNRFYRQLIKSLGELNVALTRATERLKLE